jgi:hypothetical protein
MSGPINNPINVDQSTGRVTFSGLSINKEGRYFVGVHYVSNPAAYDFVEGTEGYIDVYPSG